jgi:hypothetical protein
MVKCCTLALVQHKHQELLFMGAQPAPRRGDGQRDAASMADDRASLPLA